MPRLDMSLFEPAVLRDENALKDALSILNSRLQSPGLAQEDFIRELLGVPKLFEFAFSALEDSTAATITQRLLTTFPRTAEHFEPSLAATLLSSLSLYFWSLDYPKPNLKECHRAVDLARPVLRLLSTMTFSSQPQLPENLEADAEDEFFIKKRVKQKDRKRAKHAAKSVSVDLRPFDNLGVAPPTDKIGAQELTEDLLEDQQDMLQYYLEVLRHPDLSPIFKDAYIPPIPIEESTMPIPTGDTMNGDISAPAADADTLDAPMAFPFVQPMKAAFHFDSVEGFGEWRILVSTRADKNLRETKKRDPKLFGIIVKKIKELSNGHFSDDNQKKLTGKDVGVPVFEAKMTRDTRLVYQVDCVREFDTEIDRQALRIFGIYTHAQLDRGFWDVVGQHLAGKGKDYRKRCIHRKTPKVAGDKVYQPESFPPCPEPEAPESPVIIPNLRDEDREELHSLLVLEKFVTFSQALLNSILADQDVQHVFHMSPAEQAIVKHPGSCYVLGRSGTGKTTTMLFKMLGIERAWESVRESFDEDIPRPRQVFVTQSRVLAEKVEEYYRKLAESHAAAARTAEESALLGAQKAEDRALVDQDEEEFWRGTLPKKFGDLTDEHFPLFVTFDHLCRLLENDYKDSQKFLHSLAADEADADGDHTTVASDYMLQRRESFVSYGTFLQAYWPHLPQPLTKTLDPALIFAEIMGVIKGSEEALKSEAGYLDREAYLSLSHRQQGTFANRRDVVYELFQAYIKLKRERRDWDAADRTHAILQGLREVGVPGKKIDFFYIDEAQDNLLIDALVLRTICNNPEGMFWAGDTAQTISVGSSFRFDDLKAFLYRLETASHKKADPVKQPATFQLTTNYRSHGGIVRCAHSVVQLITKFWPHAIDTLAEEKGIIDGLKPVFFSGWDQDTVQYEQFLFGASGSKIEFGAQQCILVRDDAAREKLHEQMGDIGLILTLYESKGLEFNDVLLYNFFEDSTVDLSQWRVILNAIPHDKRTPCPRFDETKHSGVCRELKFLYVAITRARKNIWIADCSDKGEPLRMYWNTRKLVHNCTAADEVPKLAMSSTAGEWAATARTLFDNRRYLQAVRCYERAEMFRERDVAFAYYLREQARGTAKSKRTTDNTRAIAFVEAANAFLKSASVATVRNERLAYYRNAAECFVEAAEYRRAADAYLRAQEFTRSAQYYRKAGLFDEAVDVIKSHGQHIPERDSNAIVSVAKLHYFKTNRLDRATTLFENLEDALEFMEDYGFDIARASILEQSGRKSEAAEIHLVEGRPVKAIQLFMEDWDDDTSRRRAEECLLDALWQHLSFGVETRALGGSLLGELLDVAAKMRSLGKLSPNTIDELAMFRHIARKEFMQLQALGERFVEVHENLPAGLLCLDHAFSQPLKINAAKAVEIAPILQAFIVYCRALQRAASDPDPSHNASLQRLLAFQPSAESESAFTLRPGSFLHALEFQRRRDLSLEGQPLEISAWDLNTLIQIALRERLKRRVNNEEMMMSKAPATTPCPSMVVFGSCNSNSCPGAHWDYQAIDLEGYHLRVRLLFQQILIYQTISPVEHRNAVARQRRFWLSKLYHALFPPHHKLGSMTNLDLASIPETDKVNQIIKDWIRDSFYSYSVYSLDRQERLHFLTLVTELTTLAHIFDKAAASDYISRAPCVGTDKPRDMMRDGHQYIVHDLIHALDGSADSSISAGVLCLQFVLTKQLSVNVNILCQLIEYLTASFIIAWRSERHRSLHDTTLDREWILRLCSDGAPPPKSTKLLPLFLRPMAGLLEEVYTGAAISRFLTYDGAFKIDNQVRNLFVVRICRALTLLGYNIPDTKLRWDILRTIISIKKPTRRFHRSLFRYVDARIWDDLVKALRATARLDVSPFNELIQLKDSSKLNGPIRPITGIRAVIYNDVIEIPAAIASEESSVPPPPPKPKSKLRADAEEFVPAHVRTAAEQGAAEEEEDSDEEDDPVGLSQPAEEDTGIDHTVDLKSAALAVDAGRTEQTLAPPTAEEIAAARRLSAWYARVLARRRGVPTKGLNEARLRWFVACKEAAAERTMTPSYRVLFLGPLPHVLVCAEKVIEQVTSVKKKAIKRLKDAKHDEYEVINMQVDQASRASKEAHRLKRLLDPKTPDIHVKQDVGALKQAVEALDKFVLESTFVTPQGWDWDMRIAIKGIIQEKKSPTVVKKLLPELVMGDDFDLDYY